MPPHNEALIRFFLGSATDARTRRIDEIWDWDDERLEDVHDCIQWLFPLREPSAFNSAAPLLDDATIKLMRETPAIQEALHHSFLRMLAFYGLEYRDEVVGPTVCRSLDFPSRRQWVALADHNHLRLTRILASLSILGSRRQAYALLACLEEIQTENPTCIGATTLDYWRRAVQAAD